MSGPAAPLRYRRLLLKLSGEALSGPGRTGVDPAELARMAGEIRDLAQAGVEVGLVIGGGNIFRGAALAAQGLDRVTGDHMGMLATVINALAMQDALERLGQAARVMSALPIGGVCEPWVRRRALEHFRKGRVVLFAAGTGNPFFSTDSAASLRAIETGCQAFIKATKVDGVYTDDPVRNPAARLLPRLRYDEVIARGLGIMDLTAVLLCRDHRLPVRVLNLGNPGAVLRVARGEDLGTLIDGEGEPS